MTEITRFDQGMDGYMEPEEFGRWMPADDVGAEINRLNNEIAALRAALEQPLVEPEMHEAMCPALTGCKCNCPTSPAFVDKAWAQFCGGVGRGPGAPYPGMIEAFEAHYGQSFTDRDWRNESSIWAAAWKAVKAHQPPQPQQPAVEHAGKVFHAKFNIGEHVWLMKNNKPIEVVISAIEVFYVNTNQDRITYNAKDVVNSVSWLDHTKLQETLLFRSKVELLEAL